VMDWWRSTAACRLKGRCCRPRTLPVHNLGPLQHPEQELPVGDQERIFGAHSLL
jgi:hypothetical protein